MPPVAVPTGRYARLDIDRLVQVQGKDRVSVAEAGRRLGLDGTYIPRSYIEQVNSAAMESWGFRLY